MRATGRRTLFVPRGTAHSLSPLTPTSPSLAAPAIFAMSGRQYRVLVTTSAGVLTSSVATLTVINSKPPVVSLGLVPATAARTYTGGAAFVFAGSAVDGTTRAVLPATSLSWSVVLHHETHLHPLLGPVAAGATFRLTAPVDGEFE